MVAHPTDSMNLVVGCSDFPNADRFMMGLVSVSGFLGNGIPGLLGLSWLTDHSSAFFLVT